MLLMEVETKEKIHIFKLNDIKDIDLGSRIFESEIIDIRVKEWEE